MNANAQQPVQPQPVVQQPSIVESPIVSKHFHLPRVLLVLFCCLIAAAVSGYIFYILGKASNQSQNTTPTTVSTTTQTKVPPQPTTAISPTAAQDETANWNLYTSKLYGYSFKYPSEWNNSGNGGDPNLEASFSNGTGNPESNDVVLDLRTTQNKSLSTCFPSNLLQKDIVQTNDMTVDGITGKKYIVNSSGNEAFFATLYSFINNKYCHTFEFSTSSSSARDSNIKTADLIISTIKF